MTNQSREQQRNAEAQARNTAQEAKDKAQGKIESVAQEAQHQARNAANKVEEKTKSTMNSQKEEAANQIDNVASAFRETGNSLRDQDNEWMAGYADNLADQMDRFAGYLHDGDFNRFLSDARDLARSKPEIFLGGAFTLGLVAARFLKSSTPSRGNRYASEYGGYDRYNESRYSGYGESPRSRSYDRRPGRSGWDYSQEWNNESEHEARYESDYLGATEDYTRRPDPQATTSMGAPSPDTSRPIAETTRTRSTTSSAGTSPAGTASTSTPATTGKSESGRTSQASGKDEHSDKNKENTK